MTNLQWWKRELQTRLVITKGRIDNPYIRDCLMMIERHKND